MLKKLDIKIVILTICALVLSSYIGCRPKEADPSNAKPSAAEKKPAKKKKAKKPVAVIDTLAPTSVIVRVNGEEISQGEFATWERMRVRAWAVSKGWKPETVNAETRKFLLQNRARTLGELVKYTLIGQHARAKGIEPDAKEIAAQERKLLRLIKKPKASFADVAASLGEAEGKVFARMAREDALTMAVLVHSTSNDLYHVTAQEFTNRVEFVKKWNERTDATNAAVRARALQAKKEILAGAFFADVAKKYADFAPEDGEAWETFHLDEFDGDDPLGQWLARSDTGDISDPLDLDDGISIVGLKLKYESDISESNKPPVYAYEVVRCPFYAYERQDDFEGDRKAIEEDIIENRRQLAMKELHASLTKDAKIEFPCGNNLFYPRDKKKPKKKKAAPVKGEGKAAAAEPVKTGQKAAPTGKEAASTGKGAPQTLDSTKEKKASNL